MKLSEYATQQGISYRTAFRWWKAERIPGYQAPTAAIIVRELKAETAQAQRVAIYARISSHEQPTNLDRQAPSGCTPSARPQATRSPRS
jgi:predicted site-specific integrase-resolvase